MIKWMHTNMYTYIQTVVFLFDILKEELWPGTYPMLLPQSSCVYIPIFRPVAPKVCLVKIPYLALYFFPNIPDQEMGLQRSEHACTPVG